jgi:hypothetical protein
VLDFDFLEHVPPWTAPFLLFATILFFFVSRFAEAYEGFAKLIPIFGKHWRARRLAEEKQKEAQVMELAEALVSRLPRPDYDVLAQEMQHVKIRLQYMETMELINQAYLIEDAKWHAYVDIILEEKDIALDFPPRISYTEFVRKWRDEKWRPEIDRPL